ncbi:MAG: putative dehydrogenase [Kiritimatiellia bacterium]|jgi:predicted dehydrogenase
MKFLVIGLGSMGKRRIRNLKVLGETDIVGFDPREDRRAEAADKYGITTFATVEEGLATEPDALIISTPPDAHMPYALIAVEKGLHFFSEASVVDENMQELIDQLAATDLVGAPSCTLRFYPAILRFKQLLDDKAIGTPSAFTYHCGEYLPNWHPWEDVAEYYVGKVETGAAREIVPFELVWLTWLFGPIRSITSMKGKRTDLHIDIDDVYQVIMEFESGVLGHMLVDVVARKYYREGRLISEQGIIEWNCPANTVRMYQADDDHWQEFDESYEVPESFYVDELGAFVNAAKGEGVYPYTYKEDLQILQWLYQAEQNGARIQHGT